MRQSTQRGLRQGTVRQPELIGQPDQERAHCRQDSTEKLEEYTAIASLQTYLICSQDEPRAWGWAHQDDGSCPALSAELVERDHRIALCGLSVELAMAAIFRGIPDAPTVE